MTVKKDDPICARCNHPYSKHTGYGAACKANTKKRGVCGCPMFVRPVYDLMKEPH